MKPRNALAALAMLVGCAHRHTAPTVSTAGLAPLADETAPHVEEATTTTSTTEVPARPRVVIDAPRAGGPNWAALAACESGGNPKATNGTDFGAFQFDDGTWRSVTGLGGHASDYPYATQLAAAERLYAQRGRQPWPVCGRFL